MHIKQFEYKPLAQYSYAIHDQGKMILIDPERDPMPYYKYAEEVGAEIIGVIETHPHADFVSGHLQISKETGAEIYVSAKVGAHYEHNAVAHDDRIELGGIELTFLHTPGHSPDSMSIVAKKGDDTAMFTGDTLFIGDVGRPDLREKAGNVQGKRKELAQMMFKTIQNKFNHLPDDCVIYPGHGAGSLCGKNMSSDNSSTLGAERTSNWAFQKDKEEDFVEEILDGQPMIPHYFSYSVDLNNQGAKNVELSKGKVSRFLNVSEMEVADIVVDTRDESVFKKGHLEDSINIMATSANSKFETWLGAIVKPEEDYFLVADSVEDFEDLLSRVARIGYEYNLKGIMTLGENISNELEPIDLTYFKDNSKDHYTIVDVRNPSEVEQQKIFDSSINIPLAELRDRTDEIPTDKPVVVHCAAGYRSAAAASILNKKLPETAVYDLSDHIKDFK
jgi:glyoxylase-like metal-dependent hydrolase (beta-lactamase superfamily II)/rhodanese-related sulfurtransferase